MKAVATKEIVLIDQWLGCYRGGWKGVIVDDAFSHPAKVAFNLAKRIYEHAIDCGWIHPDDVVVDPFGGIGGCCFHGLMNGMRVVTCELEEKFVNLSKQNRELWREKFTGLPGFDADNWIILQGDSRKLGSLISEAGLSVSSPPYASGEKGHPSLGSVNKDDWGKDGRDITRRRGLTGEYGDATGNVANLPEGDLSLAISSPPWEVSADAQRTCTEEGTRARQATSERGKHAKKYGTTEGQIGNMVVSSPPYNPPMSQDHNGSRNGKRGTTPSEQGAFVKYGNTPGQLEGMSMEGHAIAVSSPPFPQPYTGGGGINVKGYQNEAQRPGSEDKPFDLVGQRTYQGRGGDRVEGNLETLANEGFSAAISSPPYEASLSDKRDGDSARQRKAERYARGEFEHSRPDTFTSPKNIGARAVWSGKYSLDPENVGNQQGDTFWSASRTILEQLYSVLSPGAHAIFIVKSFVRDKKIVDFPAQWAQLCESVGFKLIHDHHAMLTEHSGTQGGMFGEDKEHKVKRVSFFRRLHEKKSPETAIEYENVLCFVRQ